MNLGTKKSGERLNSGYGTGTIIELINKRREHETQLITRWSNKHYGLGPDAYHEVAKRVNSGRYRLERETATDVENVRLIAGIEV
jgi:hypothetical protein